MEFDFSKNTQVDSIDKVPEDFRGLYKEVDGKYALNSEDAGVKSSVAAITKLNNSLKAARAEAAGFKGKAVDLSTLSEFGATPEEIAAAVKNKITELEAGGGKDAKTNLEKIKSEMAKAHAADLSGRDTKIKVLTDQIYKHVVESAATSAIAELKGVPDLLMPFVTKQVKVIEVDGQQIPRVVDDAGDIRYSGVTGEPMTIKELVADMKKNDKYGRLFESEAASGAGTKSGQKAVQQTKAGAQGQELTATQKIAAGLSRMRK